MQTEKERIIELVAQGKITAQEAIALLEALENEASGASTATDTTKDKQDKQEQKKDDSQAETKERDFVKDLEKELSSFRKDLGQVGSIMFDLFNKTVEKVKDVDVSSPFSFGEKTTFQEVRTFSGDDVERVYVDLPNATVAVEPAELNDVRIVASVRASLQDGDIEATKARFLEQFVAETEDGLLRIIHDDKWSPIELTLYLPRKQYSEMKLRFLNGPVNIHDVDVRKLRVKSMNGSIKAHNLRFVEADIQTLNGEIELRDVRGRELEAETKNGRVYVDGAIEEVEASSVNGVVSVTTYAKDARKVNASSMASNIEIYVPSHLSLEGKLSTNVGKLDVGLADVSKVASQDQLLSKAVKFSKTGDRASKLFIEGNSRNGAIIVRYTTVVDTE